MVLSSLLWKKQSTNSAPKPKKPRAVRVRDIPQDFDKTALKRKIEELLSANPEGDDVRVLDLSLVHTSSSLSYACVTFSSLPGKLEALDKGVVQETRLDDLLFDTNFLGITPIFEGLVQNEPVVDIIAVPGLGSHPLGSWKAADGHNVWLRDFLPQDVPNVRVLLYGYDTTLSRDDWKLSIGDIAEHLLRSVVAFRRFTRSFDRRIIFVTHSLGGLVVKEALVRATEGTYDHHKLSLLRDCAGLLFFGVPNLGLRNDSLRTLVKNQPNEQLVQDLVVNEESEATPYLKMLARRFTEGCKGYYIPAVAIFERKFSHTVRKGADGAIRKDGTRQLLVTEESATKIGLRESDIIKIPFLRDHSSLVKFSSRSDMDYIQIVDHIKQFTAAPRISTSKEKHIDMLREAKRVVSDVGRRVIDIERELFRGQSTGAPFMEQGRVEANLDCSWITVSSGQGKPAIFKNSTESIENKYPVIANRPVSQFIRDDEPSLLGC